MENEKTPKWALGVMREKMVKDVKTECSDVMCGCPNCKNEALDIALFWDLPVPSKQEAKNIKNVVDNKLLELQHGKPETLPRDTADQYGTPADPEDPKFKL